MKNVILGTLNLCLGLKFKKDLIKSILTENNMDVLAVQESELEPDTEMNLVSITGYIYKSEKNDVKNRVGIYIKNNIKYSRCLDLEGSNSHLIIIDVENTEKTLLSMFKVFFGSLPAFSR